MITEPVYLDNTNQEKDLCNRAECKDCIFKGRREYEKHCRILVDTEFKKTCPFHKTKQEQRESLQKSRERLNSIGIVPKDFDHFFFEC